MVEFYHRALPGWVMLGADRLVREAGPIVQAITFERLSCDAYRPVGHFVVLVVPREPWAFEMLQYLNIKVQVVGRRAHDDIRDRVLAAIETELLPNVHAPLDPEQVLGIYEQGAVPTSAQVYSLAALNAYQGHDTRALMWCSRFPILIEEETGRWTEADRSRRAFLESLSQWIKTGEARARLDDIRHAQRIKFGLA
jgi:hypothetical protein